jgi:ABC-type lipoprotein export system ATPase subunit
MLPGLSGFDEKASQQLKDRANQLLEEVGLGHRTAHFPGQISGGEKQRVAVARSLINQPAVLLADEPTGALDNKNSEHLIDLLKKLNDEKGLTLLMVTHSVDSASQMKEAYRLDEGSLRQER